jgi:hypothetical protein
MTTNTHDVQQQIIITIYKINQNVKYSGLVICCGGNVSF